MVNLKTADDLFPAFLKEKQFLDGTSPATMRIYSKSWLAFKKYEKAELTEAGLKACFIELLSSGIEPGSANTYVRGVNSFLTWLFENGHTKTHLKVLAHNSDFD